MKNDLKWQSFNHPHFASTFKSKSEIQTRMAWLPVYLLEFSILWKLFDLPAKCTSLVKVIFGWYHLGKPKDHWYHGLYLLNENPEKLFLFVFRFTSSVSRMLCVVYLCRCRVSQSPTTECQHARQYYVITITNYCGGKVRQETVNVSRC